MPAPSSQRVSIASARAGFRPRRPLGGPTRGKTAAGRLRHLDAFCALYAGPLLARRSGDWRDAAFVDLGFGASPDTTLESARCFRRLAPDLPVIGVEIDPARVAGAAAWADSLTQFRLGGFNLPLEGDADRPERARLIRAFNVLRQYEPEAVLPAWTAMAGALLPGGLLVEGSSDPRGQRWVANLLRRVEPELGQIAPGLRLEAIVFGCRPPGFAEPGDFPSLLPKQLIHRMRVGEPIHAFFEAWQLAHERRAPEQVWGRRRRFVASARQLAESGQPVDPRGRWLRRGFMIWSAP